MTHCKILAQANSEGRAEKPDFRNMAVENAGDHVPICIASTKPRNDGGTPPDESNQASSDLLSTSKDAQSTPTSDEQSGGDHDELNWFKSAEW